MVVSQKHVLMELSNVYFFDVFLCDPFGGWTVVVSKTYLYALVISFSKGSISFSYGTSCEISSCGNSFKLSSLCHLVFKRCMGFNSRRTVSSIVGSNASPNQFASPSSKKGNLSHNRIQVFVCRRKRCWFVRRPSIRKKTPSFVYIFMFFVAQGYILIDYNLRCTTATGAYISDHSAESNDHPY